DLRAGRGEEPEVFEMSVAADLDLDAGTLPRSQIGGHEFHCPAKECKGRAAHPLELYRQQLGHMPFAGGTEDLDRIEAPAGKFSQLRPRTAVALGKTVLLGLGAGKHV